MKWWNTEALTGGGTRALDSIATSSLTNGDIALTVTSAGSLYVHKFNSTSTDAENSPSRVRPDDFSSAGVWEQGTIGDIIGLGTMPSGVTIQGFNGGEATLNTSDPTNDIDFEPFACMDQSNTARIQTSTTITRELDAAHGTGNGGLLNGSKAASTCYLWVAMTDGTNHDIGYLDIADVASIATHVTNAGFTYYKIFGYWFTNASSAWVGFTNKGAYMLATKASDCVLSSAVTTTLATVDHSAMVAGDYTDLIKYGARDGSVADESIYFSDDGTNVSGKCGSTAASTSDTGVNAFGKAEGSGLVPYLATRQFRASSGTLDLLLHMVKFKR